jgi:hypothetical protein
MGNGVATQSSDAPNENQCIGALISQLLPDFTTAAVILPICVFISNLLKSVEAFRPVVFLHTTTITEPTASGHAVQGPKKIPVNRSAKLVVRSDAS